MDLLSDWVKYVLILMSTSAPKSPKTPERRSERSMTDRLINESDTLQTWSHSDRKPPSTLSWQTAQLIPVRSVRSVRNNGTDGPNTIHSVCPLDHRSTDCRSAPTAHYLNCVWFKAGAVRGSVSQNTLDGQTYADTGAGPAPTPTHWRPFRLLNDTLFNTNFIQSVLTKDHMTHTHGQPCPCM